jgi:hypothetical protein
MPILLVGTVFFKVNPVASSISYPVIAALVTLFVSGYSENRKKVGNCKQLNAIAWGMMVMVTAFIVAVAVSAGIAIGYSINALELIDFTDWAVVFVAVETIWFRFGTLVLMSLIQRRRLCLPISK